MKTPTKIQKRDGSVVDFDAAKIVVAIQKANEAVKDEFLRDDRLSRIVKRVCRDVMKDDAIPTVEDVQDAVEIELIKSDLPKTAKAYILYRKKHDDMRRNKSDLMQIMRDITYLDASDSDIKRENANINGDSPMGMMLKYGSESAKYFVDNEVLPEDIALAHVNGDIHIHDKDFYNITETCCQIDLTKLFDGGFSTGHGVLRKPHGIISYAALACIAIQANQNDMHGGQSVPKFDYDMAPGVADTYETEFYKALTHELYFKYADYKTAEYITGVMKKASHGKFRNFVPTVERPKYGETNKETIDQIDRFMRWAEELGKEKNNLSFEEKSMIEIFGHIGKVAVMTMCKRAMKIADRETERQTHQAMEALIHNLNTMNSRAGAQVPFSSINFGTDTSKEGRLVIKSFLDAENEGLGGGETPIFPVSIFKVKEGVNYNEGDPNYDLFKQAMKVSAKRLFPNFSFLDAPFNLQYYKEGDPDTEVAYMGCRTRVIGNVYDKDREIVTGRGNLSFTSINLPRIAIEANHDIDKFFELLEDRMNLCFRQLLHRFDIQKEKTVKNYPFLMGQGVWIDSDKLDVDDKVGEVLKHGTLSVGFIGLAEALVALIGKHHGECEEAQDLGLRIVWFMRTMCDNKSKELGLNVTLLGTPAEGLSGRFVKIDKEKYGIIPGVTDRDYYTNSSHVPVYYNINAFKKIRIEAPYHALENAGHINYEELDGDPTQNLDAFEAIIRCMKESGVGYGSVNHPVDRDPLCGYVGIIGDTCPRCGRHDGEAISEERLKEIKRNAHSDELYGIN